MAPQIGAAAAESLLGGGVLPHLADQQLVVAVGFHRGADLLDEFVGQLVGHVQTEAGGAAVQPGVDNAALPADKVHVGRVISCTSGSDSNPHQLR